MSDPADPRDDGDAGATAASARPRSEPRPDSVLGVRPGHGANCSSLGSVVDTLFLTATVGAAVFAAVVAALGREPIRASGVRTARPEPPGGGPSRGAGSDVAAPPAADLGPAGPAPAAPRGER